MLGSNNIIRLIKDIDNIIKSILITITLLITSLIIFLVEVIMVS